MIVFQCTSCGKTYELADAIGGRTIPCNKCREPMQVPHRGQVVPPSVLSGAAPVTQQGPPPMPGPSTGMIPQQPAMPEADPYAQQPPQQQYPPQQQQYPPQQQQQYPMQQYPQQGQYPMQQPGPQGQYPMGNQGNPYAGPVAPQNINVAVHNHGGGPVEGKNVFATASLVCGIVALFVPVPAVVFILGSLAIIFAFVAYSQNKGTTGGATAGLVMGIISIVAWIAYLNRFSRF